MTLSWHTRQESWQRSRWYITLSLRMVGRQGAWSVGKWDGDREGRYWLGREFWGRGSATEALSQFLGGVTTRPLFAHVAKHNVASRRVLEKNGFRVVGEGRYTNWRNQEVEEFILKLEQFFATDNTYSAGSPARFRFGPRLENKVTWTVSKTENIQKQSQ